MLRIGRKLVAVKLGGKYILGCVKFQSNLRAQFDINHAKKATKPVKLSEYDITCGTAIIEHVMSGKNLPEKSNKGFEICELQIPIDEIFISNDAIQKNPFNLHAHGAFID